MNKQSTCWENKYENTKKNKKPQNNKEFYIFVLLFTVVKYSLD